MLVLDACMLSEIMRPEPERKIADWIVHQPSDELFTAAVCQAEILAGPAIMPSGRRRVELEEATRAMFSLAAPSFGAPAWPEEVSHADEIFSGTVAFD